MLTEDVPLFVGGVDVAGAGQPIERENPADFKEIAGSVSSASIVQAEAAIGAAAACLPAWSRFGIVERSEMLRHAWGLGDVIRADLALLLTKELGKGPLDTRGELDSGIAYANYLSDHVAEVMAERPETTAEGRFLHRRVPYGVVLTIIPWNAPLNIASMLIAPALVAGNTVVVKPSPLAPLAVTNYLREVAMRLPPGVLNVVNGDGDVGSALVAHEQVGKIAFTGSTAVGAEILRGSASNIVPCLLELGGNDAAVVLPDAALTDDVIARMIFGTFLTAGQVCMAIKRLLVHESILDALVERYREVAQQVLVLGDPMDPAVSMGPLVSRGQMERVADLVGDARVRGATVYELGRSSTVDFRLSQGYFMRPTLVTGVDRSARIVKEEQFGPTVPVLPFSSTQEAIELANDSKYGLSASIWSVDEGNAFTIGQELAAGTVFVNTHNRGGMTFRAPIGGHGWSGYGRNGALTGIEEFSNSQTVSLLERTRAGISVRDYAV